MKFYNDNNRLIIKDGCSHVWIEAWGKDSLRIQMTCEQKMDENNWALDTPQKIIEPCITISGKTILSPWYKHYSDPESHQEAKKTASITNGKITAKVNEEGWISFVNQNNKVLLEEYWRNRWRIDRYCVPLNLAGREIKPIMGTSDYSVTVQFEAYDNEKLFGMGQYQDKCLDKKGCYLELAQRNAQATVPFVLSNRGYGFLWNNPGIGSVNFASNITKWHVGNSKKIDYWITAGDSPADIENNYTAVTGRVPMMPDFAMGFWQCKLRYRTQEELLNIAREYHKRKLPLSVLVVDFFHWTKQGDFKFDPIDWPDPEKMIKELSSYGIKLMVSVWPTVDERSENFSEMAEQGLLISFDRGVGVNMTWMGNTTFFDTTNPLTRNYVWEKCKKNYFGKGIDLFWLDEAEPEYGIYDFDLYRYSIGPASAVSNIYPKCYAQGFYEGLKKEGVENVISLVRCAWAGSQKYGVVVWSGDVHSDFKTLRIQLQAGLSMNIAGIPWWTTDIGGFLGGDILDEHFRELLVRWFEWAVFCPVLRLHGERPPFKNFKDHNDEYHGLIKQMESGQDNEIWSFGDDVYKILKNLLTLRERLKPYITIIMKQAHEIGTPVMRPLFYDFPNDTTSWNISDEYMFGNKLLIAPILNDKERKRSVYLPPLSENESWIEAATEKIFSGNQTIEVEAPLELIPVFTKGTFDIKIW